MTGRRRRVDRTGSAPKRRSATAFSAEEVAEWHAAELAGARPESAQPETGHVPAYPGPSDYCGFCMGPCFVGEVCPKRTRGLGHEQPREHHDPLQSPQHKRALRESSRADIKEVVAKWLRMGASPGDLADHLEGARVEMADEARKRGRQG